MVSESVIPQDSHFYIKKIVLTLQRNAGFASSYKPLMLHLILLMQGPNLIKEKEEFMLNLKNNKWTNRDFVQN